MSTDGRIVLGLVVDREADPISGTVTQDGHMDRPFTGWLALTDAIESIRDGDAETTEPALHARDQDNSVG
jgi:hypothetical protein